MAHGGEASDAFHLVIPALPGFGFSERPSEPGWGVERIARAWTELMRRLGYARFVAQGGDWGSAVTLALGAEPPPELLAIHLNMLNIPPEGSLEEPDQDEKRAMAAARYFADVESAYARLQATRPQTIGYALADSPIGQAAWIYEKLTAWSDCNGAAENIFTMDEILDTVMMYWLPNTSASSARLYWESMASFRPKNVNIPVGYSQFPKEITMPPKIWAEKYLQDIFYWNELSVGGHFAAFEQPGLFVNELRSCFAGIR